MYTLAGTKQVHNVMLILKDGDTSIRLAERKDTKTLCKAKTDKWQVVRVHGGGNVTEL